ncbi:hypothetical protein M8818_002783 [Zalaria obscura]|uniref:Uncharacterized protein n=1 Tax=Zalaria obscura TaxID=2024903 RepID=A0ACC3SHG4_9PEZI
MPRGRHGGYKRKRRVSDSSRIGAGDTLARLNGDARKRSRSRDRSRSPARDAPRADGDDEGWETVDRSSKRRKRNDANSPAIAHSANARLQSFVKINDLQNLVLYLLADGTGPQWVSVRHHKSIEKVVVLMVPGLEAGMFNGSIALDQDAAAEKNSATESGEQDVLVPGVDLEGPEDGTPQKPRKKLNISPDDYYPVKLVSQKLPAPLEPLTEVFPHIWPIKTPGDFSRMHSPLYAMLNSALPKSKEEKKTKGPQFPAEGKNWQNKRTPVTEFIATRDELLENGFALHPAHLHTQAQQELEAARRHKNVQTAADGWIDMLDITSLSEGDVPSSSVDAGSVTAGRNVLVVDCEMVTTTTDKFALGRISLIDWSGAIIMDELVKPPDPIRDYLTPYSGLTKEVLDPVTTTLEDIHAKLRTLLTPQTILAGHSLDSDLRALKMSYPFVIDTALLFPHPKGPPQKSSLKWLSQKYLNRAIQNRGPAGHDSVEDAKASLDLIKQKCEKGRAWGTPDATGESIFKRLARYEGGRTGAVVDWGDPTKGYGGAAEVAIACENDGDVVEGVKRAVAGEEGGDVPKGGVDFIWARLRELEAVRGWWNKTKSPDAAERLARTLADNAQEGNGTLTEKAEEKDDDAATAEGATSNPSSTALSTAVSKTVSAIQQIWASLPERTAFIVYSGSGDPRELRRMQALNQEFKTAYRTMKWDELPVKWTDVEEQQLKKAAMEARSGVGFIAVKGPG